MAKPGPKPKEKKEISNCNINGRCDVGVYCRKENNKFIFTDIRTTVNFEEYCEIEKCENFTEGKTAFERYKKYLTASKFHIDCNAKTRESYRFKVMMDLYQILWNIDTNKFLNSAETLVSPNQAIYRWNCDLCKDGTPGKKSIDLDKVEKLHNSEAQEFETFIYGIATIGNFMPVVAKEQKVLNWFNERFDNLLVAIKEYYCNNIIHKHFDKGIQKWLDLFLLNDTCGWKGFVDNNYLKGSFVDENYNVVEFDETLGQLTQMIYDRSVVMIQEYEHRVGTVGAK